MFVIHVRFRGAIFTIKGHYDMSTFNPDNMINMYMVYYVPKSEVKGGQCVTRYNSHHQDFSVIFWCGKSPPKPTQIGSWYWEGDNPILGGLSHDLDTWLIIMVDASPKDRVAGPLPHGHSWLTNRGYWLLSVMILQVYTKNWQLNQV